MGLKEFQDLLDRYGGDPMTWPADQRPEALEFARTSPEAFRLLRETSEVEKALIGGDLPEPDMGSVDKVMDRIRAHEEAVATMQDGLSPSVQAARPAIWREIRNVLGGFVYRPLLLIAMASLIGVIVGFADRSMSARSSYDGLMYFIMTL